MSLLEFVYLWLNLKIVCFGILYNQESNESNESKNSNAREKLILFSSNLFFVVVKYRKT